MFDFMEKEGECFWILVGLGLARDGIVRKAFVFVMSEECCCVWKHDTALDNVPGQMEYTSELES